MGKFISISSSAKLTAQIEESEKSGKHKEKGSFDENVILAEKEIKDLKEILPDILAKVSILSILNISINVIYVIRFEMFCKICISSCGCLSQASPVTHLCFIHQPDAPAGSS